MDRTEHLNAVLRAIRNVNQLIAREKDSGRLLQGICDNLVETRGYRMAWIVLVDGSRRAVAWAQARAGAGWTALLERAKQGDLAPCMAKALAEPGVLVLDGNTALCADCPLREQARDSRVMAARLETGGHLEGVMVATVASAFTIDAEEQALFEEAAQDVALALRGIHLEEERACAERALRLDESRLEALLQLNQMTEAPLRQLTDFVLEEAVRLTESSIGYLAFVNEDESVLTMHSWSKAAMAECAIIDKPIIYPVVNTGLWGEAVRQRRPVITNDYLAPNPWKKGYPGGHVALTRHMNVPVFDGERIVVVAGVGNKPRPYDEADVRQLTLLMQGMWRQLQRKQAEQQLREAKDELEGRVQQRTAELNAAIDELKQERYLLHTLMDYLPHNIYFKDAASRFIRINRAMANFFGLQDAREAIGKSDQDFFTPEHAMQALADEREILRTGRPVLDKEEKETWPDGHNTWAATTKMPLYDEAGQIVGTFGISRDITEQKQAAEVLRVAKEAAEAANRAKSDFLANMSHEIRTPLNAIIGMTELVLKGHLSPQQREFLATVRDSGEALLSVINDILDFSKIEAGKLLLDEDTFDLRESLGDTVKSFALRSHQQGLELACHIHPEVPRNVVGDYHRLRQVIVNLVGNAVKFTERGEVAVEVIEEARYGQETVLRLTVSDTGIGIPAEKQSAIFEMFEQVDASITRRHGGTGLGLAIASRLVGLMGGRIWVESEVGLGSRFHFTVRLRVADSEPVPAAAIEPAALHGMRALVVDDNATNRRILEEVLRSWKMVPTTAASALEAIELLHQADQAGQRYDLVLTDAHMPQVDGFTLAQQIKRDSRTSSTVVMMLTSGDRAEDTTRCEELGIAAYLLKPIKQSELLEAIELALGIATPQPEAIRPARERPEGARGLRILLAEDSLVNQKLAIALLEGEGHSVALTCNGREALDAMDASRFDLVLMDLQMPEMDGLEATARIRARERQTGGHVPIIAMTAHALKGDRERCLAAGMDAYIAKPIRARELFEAIDVLSAGSRPAAAQPVETPPAPASTAADMVDWPAALAAVRGNEPLLQTVVEAALEEIPRLMTAVRQAIRDRDARSLRLAAHTLKGSVRYFVATRVFDAAFALERMGQAGELQEAERALATLEQEVAKLVPILTGYVNGGANT